MALPAGWAVTIESLRVDFDPTGKALNADIRYRTVDSTGKIMGSGHASYAGDGPTNADNFTGDGKTTTFTTSQAPYAGTLLNVQINSVTQSPGYTTAVNADGTIAVTFAVAPAGPDETTNPPTPAERVTVVYSTGPGLWNEAADMTKALGLAQATGTLFSSASHASAHKMVADVAATIQAWAIARVHSDCF